MQVTAPDVFNDFELAGLTVAAAISFICQVGTENSNLMGIRQIKTRFSTRLHLTFENTTSLKFKLQSMLAFYTDVNNLSRQIRKKMFS